MRIGVEGLAEAADLHRAVVYLLRHIHPLHLQLAQRKHPHDDFALFLRLKLAGPVSRPNGYPWVSLTSHHDLRMKMNLDKFAFQRYQKEKPLVVFFLLGITY